MTPYSLLPTMTAPKRRSSSPAMRQLMRKEWPPCTSEMFTPIMASLDASSPIETPDSPPLLPEVYVKLLTSIRMCPPLTTLKLMDNRSDQISGWNNTYDTGAMHNKTIGWTGYPQHNLPIIPGQVQRPSPPPSHSSWDGNPTPPG